MIILVRLDQSWLVKYQRFLIACAIVCYIIIAMTVGVLAVYFGSQRPKSKLIRVLLTDEVIRFPFRSNM